MWSWHPQVKWNQLLGTGCFLSLRDTRSIMPGGWVKGIGFRSMARQETMQSRKNDASIMVCFRLFKGLCSYS